MNEKSVARVKRGFSNAFDKVADYSLKYACDMHGVAVSDLGTMLERDDDKLRAVVKDFITTHFTGRIMPWHYAGVVAGIAALAGKSYKVIISFSVPVNSPKYKEDVERYKAGGVVMANHCYVMVGDVCYQYYNGVTDNMHHLESVVM